MWLYFLYSLPTPIIAPWYYEFIKLFFYFCVFAFIFTHRKLHHQSINNAAENSHEIKSVPGILEVALKNTIQFVSTKKVKLWKLIMDMSSMRWYVNEYFVYICFKSSLMKVIIYTLYYLPRDQTLSVWELLQMWNTLWRWNSYRRVDQSREEELRQTSFKNTK